MPQPTVTSEEAYETLALGCTKFTTADPMCDSDSTEGAQILNS